MAKCVHCSTHFYAADMSSPREDCDCGRCESRADYRSRTYEDREPTEDELEEYRASRR